jgi:hypothetical protein
MERFVVKDVGMQVARREQPSNELRAGNRPEQDIRNGTMLQNNLSTL